MKTTVCVGMAALTSAWVALGCTADSHGEETENDLGSVSSACSTATGPESRALSPSTQFYVPPAQRGAVEQIASTLKHRRPNLADAFRLTAMEATPSAVWFEDGAPADVRKNVQSTMRAAAAERRVPVLVAYFLPFRDCAQYSAGGAKDAAEYEAWIDAFAAGLGRGKALVILEPDSLGLIPYNTTVYGALEWCQPTVTNTDGTKSPAPGADAATRYALLRYAVNSIQTQAPSALVYLDGTHSAWLGTNESAYRLARAGVEKAQGFFLNVSNYRKTSEAVQYGTWVSDELAAMASGAAWLHSTDANGNPVDHWDWLPAQYVQDASGTWVVDYGATNVAKVDDALTGPMNGALAQTRFVIDTSRNGQGPLDTAPYGASPYTQPAAVLSALASGAWCNAPGAGLGSRPTANTGVSLVDAYLWIKTPGESDGTCDIAGGARGWDYSQYNPWGVTGDTQNHFDPLWGIVDPAAGAWFPEEALDLARNANPSLL